MILTFLTLILIGLMLRSTSNFSLKHEQFNNIYSSYGVASIHGGNAKNHREDHRRSQLIQGLNL